MAPASVSRMAPSDCLQASILDSVAEGVVVVSQQANIVFTNPSFDSLFGYDTGELLGQPASILNQGKHAEGATTVTVVFSQLHTQGAWQGEIWNRKKDGTPFTTYARITAFDMDGTQYYVSVQEDITERRRLEAQFYERERLALIGRVAVNMSHEIGNRLNSLSSSVQLLERALTKSHDLSRPDLVETVQDLKAETAHLKEVLRALRELSMPYQLVLQPVDVNQVAATVVQAQQERCAERKIRLVLSTAAHLPHVLADQDKLTQVVAQLCTNAIDAMPSGGTLTVGAAATTGMLSLTVHDTGAGIDKGLDPFEPFLTTRAGGSGLGLAVVKQLVLSQGGTIRYSSTPQDGTTFSLQLPLAPHQLPPSPPPPPAPDPPLPPPDTPDSRLSHKDTG